MTVPFLSPCFQKVDFPGVNQLQFPLQLILSTDIIFLYSDTEVLHMAEINIARTIVTKRREKGMTQEELAEFMGVSKASVSKWETGGSLR
mgnify:CR=1 FL=1